MHSDNQNQFYVNESLIARLGGNYQMLREEEEQEEAEDESES